MKGPVTQPWTHHLTFMQQTVLLTAVRGPDGMEKYHPFKYLLRWYRRCVLISSLDGRVLTEPFERVGGSFMGPSFDTTNGYGPSAPQRGDDWRLHMHRLVSQYLQALDAIPHHFQLHFMHAAEIVGYKHPDLGVRAFWHGTYRRLVHDMHLWPETEDQMDERLGDDRTKWLSRNDPATVT